MIEESVKDEADYEKTVEEARTFIRCCDFFTDYILYDCWKFALYTCQSVPGNSSGRRYSRI